MIVLPHGGMWPTVGVVMLRFNYLRITVALLNYTHDSNAWQHAFEGNVSMGHRGRTMNFVVVPKHRGNSFLGSDLCVLVFEARAL